MNVTKRILVVEDNLVLAKGLKDNLVSEGFQVECVGDGGRAVTTAAAFGPDSAVLDLLLPGVSGFDLCRAFRSRNEIPVLVLTALSQRLDKLRCLGLGADDYMTKPFDLDELLARVRAILRRTRPDVVVLGLGPLTIDFRSRRATREGTDISLTDREFDILHYLAERQGRLVYRAELLKEVWGFAESPFTRPPVDKAVARLRKKIEADAHHPQFIHTVRGDGYCLTAHGQPIP